MKRSIRFLSLLVLALWTGGNAWAEDGLYLVGGATASGWNAGEFNRSPVALMQKDANTWIWYGKLTTGEGDAGAFKIPNQSGNWDGYWAPSAWYSLQPGVEADLSTNGTGDNKFSPAEEGLYKVTINTSTLKILAEKLTSEPTKDGDYYLIGSVAEFGWFAAYIASDDTKASKARLTADLDFTTEGFFPLASDKFKFKGELDGAGHTVKFNITGAYNNVALVRFATDGANIHDLVVEGSVEGNAKVGGVIAHLHDGGEVKLTNVINKATVHSSGSSDANAAGLVGCAEGSTKLTALNCANLGAVSGQDGQCAAFCGWSQPGTTFTNCWNGGAISNYDGTSQLYRNSGAVSAVNCYDATGNSSYGQGEKLAQATIASGELCYMLNGKKSTDVAWFQTIGTDEHPLPFGTAIVYANGAYQCDGLTPKEGSEKTFSNTEGNTIDPHQWNDWGFCTVCDAIQPDFVTLTDGVYQITNAKELNWLAVWTDREDASVKAVMTQDIDMSEVANFPGLGSGARNFTGEFDGQRHILSNLKMNWTDRNEGVGFVNRAANGAKVKNLTIANTCSFKGQKAVGGIIGGLYGGGDVYIDNCGNEGAVESTGQNAGGIVGVCFNGTILHLTNVYNIGIITGATAGESGSLSGWMANAVIKNCYSVAGYPTADDTHGFQEGNQFARGSGIQLTNCYDFGTGDWGTNNGDWGSAFGDGRKITDADDETEMSRVFAGLFDGDGGNVWRMEYNDWPHPVLYDTDVVLKENNYNRFVEASNVDLTLVRTTVAGTWNTICLPFDVADPTTLFGTGAKVAELQSLEGTTLKFSVVSAIEAGKPYLVLPTEAMTEKALTGVSLVAGTTDIPAGDLTFTGVYDPTAAAAGSLFISTGNKLSESNGEGTIKAFRAYFQVAAGGAKAVDFVVDDVATGIINIDGTVETYENVYTLSGVRVEKPIRGLYIVNGKKTIVK